MKVLVVTPNKLQFRLYASLLDNADFELVHASSGPEAIAIAEDRAPELILLDLAIAGMDALQLAMRLKAHVHSVFTPLIFLLERGHAERTAECYVAGADDVLVKPVEANLLRAKLLAQRRTKQLNLQLDNERKELAHYRQYREYEDEVARRLMDNARAKSLGDCGNVSSYERAAADFSGDIFLSGISPRGNLYVLVGDATGHGLPSSIATLPVSQVFFAMVRKGLGVAEIASEINEAMHRFLPDDMFVAASIFELESRGQRLTAWSGGLPDALLLAPDGSLRDRIVSAHMPLGAEDHASFERDLQMIELRAGERLLIYSDGAQELFNGDGSLLDQDAFEQLAQESYREHEPGADPLQGLVARLEQYLGDEDPHDDITLVQISQGAVEVTDSAPSAAHAPVHPPRWQLLIELGPESMRNTDPVLQLVDMLGQSPGLADYGDIVFTIVSEMYTNALDHGVLGLDSQMKHDEDGFIDYYSQKAERLDDLTCGRIQLEGAFQPSPQGGSLCLAIEDSGKGFDYQARFTADMNDDVAHGRGIPLMLRLCTAVEYSLGGRRLEVQLPVHF